MTQQSSQELDQNWSNYWQGRTGVNAGSALVGIEHHPEIREFWQASFSEFPKSVAALDLACGAGTVAKVLNELGFSNVHGLDISSAAIDVLKKRLPDVSGFVSPADATPFETENFDLIVSQYGFEYGDHKKVIPEIGRILKPGGKFIALSHVTDGGIHKEVSEQLDGVVDIKESGFIDAARELFSAAMNKESAKAPKDVELVFRPAQMKLLDIAKRDKGLAEYLYVNTQRMFNNRQQYFYKDIVSWLDGMDEEVRRFMGRMESMKTAAISDEKIDSFLTCFEAAGISLSKPIKLQDQNNEALGWIFNGIKT